jgi:alpha-mannosidase
MNPRHKVFLSGICWLAVLTHFSAAQSRNATEPINGSKPDSIDLTQNKTLFLVGYAHLDTQWRWAYSTVIRDYIAHTLHDNFKLIEKYPDYIFNFTGSRRYEMMKEYYPGDFEKVKQYVAAGRWFPAGSSVDENDVNMPSLESIVRQILYGNEFFKRELGVVSNEYMLPDCFGFPASLPTILHHAGIKGFSTQKLSWGSANGIPFKVGNWTGPDGNSVIAALDPGSYGSKISEDLSQNKTWRQRIERTGAQSGAYTDYHYYGTGDVGGAPAEDSVRWMEESIKGKGPIRVVSSTARQMFDDIQPEQRAKLPSYTGDLLLTNHSAGSLTSKAYNKRWNRKNELLADAAERASVTAQWFSGWAYPSTKLLRAWDLVLGSQMHDMLPGTTIPAALRNTWNDEILALNQFAAVTTDAAGAVASVLDTRTEGVALVVYNPLSRARDDVVAATVTFPGPAPTNVRVVGPSGEELLSQINKIDGNKADLLFLAHLPSVGFAVFDVRPLDPRAVSETGSTGALKVSLSDPRDPADPSQTSTGASRGTDPDSKVSKIAILENDRYKLRTDTNGDIASIYDKKSSKELLESPARLGFLHEKPRQWPAWNMDFEDRQRPPEAYVDGPVKVRITESGPVRAAVEIEREARGSHFVQQIRLSAGSAGETIEVVNQIDWQTRESSLEAIFPLTVSNPLASYEDKVGVTKRGNNEPKKFMVPQQQWFDLTDANDHYGAAILNDCKFGSDKPNDNTVRLTLLYTPGVRNSYQDQATQDFGHHEMVFAIAGHEGDWQQGDIPWKARRLNQPPLVFQSISHFGPLGREFSLFHLNSDQVEIAALKKAEANDDEIVVRLKELNGKPARQIELSSPAAILAAREVNGQEQEIEAATIQNGRLTTELLPFGLRAFALKLKESESQLAPVQCQPVDIPYNLTAIAKLDMRRDEGFDPEGRVYPAEQLPEVISSEGIQFKIAATRAKNALTCQGQTIDLPSGKFDHVYLLAAALNGDTAGIFQIGSNRVERTVQDWSGYIGQWDDRRWRGPIAEVAYRWDNELDGLVPGFIKRDPVAWYVSHRNLQAGGTDFYQYCYLYKYGFVLPENSKSLTLPDNSNIRILAITVAKNNHEGVSPAKPLYDTLGYRYSNPPRIVPDGGQFADAVLVTIDPPLYWQGNSLHYTLDGSDPTDSSPVYSKPFTLDATATVKVRMLSGTESHPTASARFVINDTTRPAIQSVSSVASLKSVVIRFTKPIRKETAETVSNYRFDPPSTVQSAALAEDGKTVVLVLGQPMSTSQLHLTVEGIQDTSPSANHIAAKSIDIKSSQPVYALDSFVGDGKSSKEQTAKTLPAGSKDPWTINLFVKTSRQPEDDTLISGLGRTDNTIGWGRYLAKSDSGIVFWTAHEYIETSAPLDLDKWQMLSATYDGEYVRIYKNGEKIGEGSIEFAEDQPVVKLAPPDPWEGKQQFYGRLSHITIWNTALQPQNLKEIFDDFGLNPSSGF